jgi:hypothetical protein
MTMKKLMSVVVGLLIATSAYAGGWGVGVSVNIGVPFYTPAPVVYTPAPVVYTSPVYLPRQVIYAPTSVVYVPTPVVCPSPIGISYPTPVTVYFPATFHHHHHYRR